jgi:hypothetical protein
VAKVLVTAFNNTLVVDAERVPTLLSVLLEAEEYEQSYRTTGYIKKIKPSTDEITVTPLSDEHYKIFKIAGEQE